MPLYHLYVYTRKFGDYAFESDSYALVDKTYGLLAESKARWKRIKPA
jgi:hypothetical protein